MLKYKISIVDAYELALLKEVETKQEVKETLKELDRFNKARTIIYDNEIQVVYTAGEFLQQYFRSELWMR